MSNLFSALIVGAVSLLAGCFIGWIVRWLYARVQLNSSEQMASRIKQEAKKEAEATKKEYMLEAKNQLLNERNQQEREFRERRIEIQKNERRLVQKEENLETKLTSLEKRSHELAEKELGVSKKESELAQLEKKWRGELEKIAHLSCDEAKRMIMASLENEAKHDAQALLNKIESEAQHEADKKARELIVSAMQRVVANNVGDANVASVSLPSDEMKGRIIGREGRNIRTLESITGVDIIIDDTPEAVIISCFDPVRKEIARQSLERLVQDGRIHPARIEEIVYRTTKEINQKMMEEGEKVLFDLGIHNFSNEAIRAIGRLYFRTSYGQNVLFHSKEVAIFAGLLASELGLDKTKAKRAGLLHDIGKGMDSDGNSNHAELGAEFAKKIKEDPVVVNAIAAHHDDVKPETLEAVIIQIADALSAARPGARKETYEIYIKRLEALETIAKSFDGVEKVFAIQAGRELRILVNSDSVSDQKISELAKEIAKRIETEVKYPGRIKVTMIRETRVMEYAR